VKVKVFKMPERHGPRIFGQDYLEAQTLNYIEISQEEILRRNQAMLQRNRAALETHSQRMASQPNTALEIRDEESQSCERDSDDDMADMEHILGSQDETPDSNLLLLQELIQKVRGATARIKEVQTNEKLDEVLPEEDYNFTSSDTVNQTLVQTPVVSIRAREDEELEKFSWTKKIEDWFPCPAMGIFTRHRCLFFCTICAVTSVVSAAAVFSILCPTMQKWGNNDHGSDNNNNVESDELLGISKGSSSKFTITSLIYAWALAFFPMEFEF